MNIPVVVAMQYEVSNITASQFAYEFYERLAKGEPVDIAAQNGRRTIALETRHRKRDFATPVIFMRVRDGYLFNREGDESAVKSDVNSAGDSKARITQNVQQVNGKYNINMGEARDVRIGDNYHK
jgi:hypothetical protein